MDGGANFSQLQYLLKLAYSEQTDEQQKAAMDLSKLVESTVFPAVSFGPISHALCRLVSADNRSVVCYGARALKLLLLDDALRPQAIVAGVPSVVCTAIKRWDDEVLCLRELLAALQTLCWDKLCIKSVLQHKEILKNVCDYIHASDSEVCQLSLAVLANTLSFCDSLLLTDTVAIETLGTALPHVLKVVSSSKDRAMRFYAAAAVANASSNPRLAELITAQDGLAIIRDLEKQSVAQMHVLGSRMADCAQAALYRISLHKEGDRQFANSKFRFKWGNRPVMELSLKVISKYSGSLCICFSIWLLIILYTFSPVVFS